MIASDKQLDTAIDVVTPENIAFSYRLAGPFRRMWAFLIDLAIRLAVVGGVAILGVILLGMAGMVVAVPIFFGVMLIVIFVAEWFYGGLFETYMNGQTPGKKMLGIRVVTTKGQPINGLQAIMRNLLRYADLFPMLSLEVLQIPAPMYTIPTAFVGLAFMTLTPRFQRLGDLVCDTMVIVEERQWLIGVTRLDDPRAVQLAAYLPMKFQVSRSMAKAISAYVERRRFFSVPRRREIARHLGEPLLERFGLPLDTSHDLLLCALYYRTFIADRQDDDEHARALAVAPAPAMIGAAPYGYPGYAPMPYGPYPGYPPSPVGYGPFPGYGPTPGYPIAPGAAPYYGTPAAQFPAGAGFPAGANPQTPPS